MWARARAKIKQMLAGGGMKKEEEAREVRELQIGEPTDFQHHVTGGAGPLRSPVVVGKRWSGKEEEEWEDVGVEDTRGFGRE